MYNPFLVVREEEKRQKAMATEIELKYGSSPKGKSPAPKKASTPVQVSNDALHLPSLLRTSSSQRLVKYESIYGHRFQMDL